MVIIAGPPHWLFGATVPLTGALLWARAGRLEVGGGPEHRADGRDVLVRRPPAGGTCSG